MTTRPRRGRHAVDPARRAAYELLRQVADRGAYANLAMPAIVRARGLTGRDAAFATELAYGTLRGLGLYDEVISSCADRQAMEIDAELLDVLRLGAHQLLGMRVPTHAAVSTSVDLARSVGGDGRSRFANAVLRRMAERDRDAWIARVAPPRASDPVGHLAVVHSHPRWIVSALRDALGGDLAETEVALAADNKPAAVTLAARPGRGTVEELVATGGTAAPYSPLGVVLPHGDPATVAAVAEGRAHVQDEGSQLVTLALLAAPVDGRDERWLDMAAGPGGKAALLAGVAAQRGARVLCSDVQASRARLVGGAVGGPGGRAAVITADGTRPAWAASAFDRVLLDAPCTGLGALRRRPDARWRREPSDIPPLRRLQEALLDSALSSVRPGGLVAYVTCSPHLAETRQHVERLRRRRADVEIVDARPYFPGVPHLGDGPDVQLWPHRHGTDAMYLALLRRR
jgi:16S rRNA (cytosine967-C5)-methyltransferase